MKKVLLVIIDALASRVVLPALRENRLPNFARLIEHGAIRDECSSIFPSITPAATASLVTGCYPAEHGITGAYWYDQQHDRVEYYADDIWAILRRGIGRFFQSFAVELNHKRVRAETIYQTVERAGLRAACINFIWYRGDQPHTVSLPWLLRLHPQVSSGQTVLGPSLLFLGDFTRSRLPSSGRLPRGRGGVFHRYGFEDGNTARVLRALAANGPLPDLTLAYFPDNDFESHEEGPRRAVSVLEEIDERLGDVFHERGGLEAFLEETAVVITGDHSQSDLSEDVDAGVDLDELLSSFNVVPAGENWSSDDELMVCPNLRAAQIYLRRRVEDQRDLIVERLLEDPRIDQVIWREEDGGDVPLHHVGTREHGVLSFRASLDGNARPLAIDEYGGAWTWHGDLAAVGATRTGTGTLDFGDYPNALERITASFVEHRTGDLWVTARPGYAFRLPNTDIHRRGSHGSLHALDSISPLLVAGAPAGTTLPLRPRSVDVAGICLEILGLPPRYPVGATRAPRVARAT